MDHLKIRKYETDDKSKVVEVCRMNVPHYFAKSELKDLSKYLDHQIEEYFVLVLNSEIIGAGGINFENKNKTGIISWDFLHPKQQGKGYGKALLQYRLEVLRKLQIKNVVVRTSQLTYKFYEKGGFKTKEIQKDYWAKGFDLYEMELGFE